MPKMTVTKEQAVRILTGVGLLVAKMWDTDKLQDRIRHLHEMEGAADKIDAMADDGLRKLAKKAVAACEQDVPIFVTEPAATAEDGPADSEEQPMEETEVKKPEKKGKPAAKPAKPAGKPQKPVKPAKSAAKAEKPAKPKKERATTVEKDEWGTRKGTRTARINAALLGGKALTTKEIEEKADARGIHSHLVKLKGMGVIVRTEDGKYQRKDAQKAKSAAGKPAKKK